MVIKSGQDGVVKDVAKALSHFKKSCDGGNPLGCFNAGGILLQGYGSNAPNMPEALKYSLLACERGHYMACVNAALMLELGDGVQQDQVRAGNLRTRAYDLKTKGM